MEATNKYMDPQDPKSDSLSALEEDMDAMAKENDRQGEEREQCVEDVILDDVVSKLDDKSDDIQEIKANNKPWNKVLAMTLSKTIYEALDGNLSVPEYISKVGPEQTVFLYVGTHWIRLSKQKYFDFIKDCAKKLGVSESEYEDPNFMFKVTEHVCFRASRAWKQRIPKGEVWINLLNGTIEINAEGKIRFRNHRREDYFTYALPYAYDPTATCPKWHKFLDEVLAEPEAQTLLAEYFGYSFVHSLKLEKMLVLYGPGGNGKSVILDLLELLLGSENVSNVSLSDLTADPEKRSLIEHKLANISHESGKELDTSVLKIIVSGEPLTCRVLYVGTRIITDYARLVTSFNILPVPEQTHGFYRRFIIMPLKKVIEEDKIDIDLSRKLATELPGILNWVLEALQGLIVRRAFTKSPLCQETLEHYKLSGDSTRLFLNECCETNSSFPTGGKELYAAYKAYCWSDGLKALGKQRFFDRLESLDVNKDNYNNNYIFNVRIINNACN